MSSQLVDIAYTEGHETFLPAGEVVLQRIQQQRRGRRGAEAVRGLDYDLQREGNRNQQLCVQDAGRGHLTGPPASHRRSC